MRSIVLPGLFFFLCLTELFGQDIKAWNAILEKYEQGKVYAGIRRAEKKLSGRSPDRDFLVLRADGLNRIGEFARAKHDARQAMEHVSGDMLAEAQLQLGIALMDSGQPDSARVWFEKVIEANGKGEALLRMGRMDLVEGRREEALERFSKLLAKDPDNVRALLERGAAYAAVGDTSAARADLDRAVELAPRDPVAWNSRGFHVHAMQGRHRQAISDYDQAIKFDPNYSFAFNNRGWSLYKLGEVKKAQKNIRLAARKRATNPYVYRNLGVIALETGDRAKACIHFRKAMSLNFEQLHGPEVSELLQANCNDPQRPAEKQPLPRSNAPEGAPVEKKPPVRTNAP